MANTLGTVETLAELEHKAAAFERALDWDWDVAAYAHDCPHPHGERCPIAQPPGAADRPFVIDPWDELGFRIGRRED